MIKLRLLSTVLQHGLESFGNNKNRVRATPPLHLNLKICGTRSGRVYGVATHAVGRMQVTACFTADLFGCEFDQISDFRSGL